MEYRSVVFNAARDGNLPRLKIFLEGRPPAEVRNLLSSCTYGTPPLVIASRNGHVDVVRYLIEKEVDIEQTGCVVFDGETVEKVPSLWCAAAAGHFEIVKLLVDNKADVNHTTATNSTPLRAACFDGHLNIITYLVERGADVEIANKHGHTSLMIACYKSRIDVVKYLLSVNASVNTKSLKGNTALHDSAEAGNTEIVELLLDHGAVMDVDINGLSPMLSAASFGHKSVVEFLCQHEKCSLSDKINGLELLGATYVDKKRDIVGAFRCWRHALLLRRQYDLPFEKFALTRAAHVAYQGQREAADLAQLDTLVNDADKIRMQSLITRERILGPAHPDTTYYIRYRGAVYADFGVFSRCIDLWLYALNIQQSIMEPLCSLTLGSFMSFAELFCFLLNDSTRNQQQNFSFNNNNDNQNQAPNLEPRSLRFSDVYLILNMAVDEIGRWLNMEICKEVSMEGVASKGPFSFPNRTSILNAIDNCRHVERDKNGDHKLLLVVIHLLALAQRCLTHEQAVGVKFGRENVGAQKNGEKFKLRKTVHELLRVDPRDGQRSSLLHLACKEDSTALGNYPLCRFPSLPVIELLLESGADWYSLDQEGRSPLHLCLANKIHRRSVAACLLNKGASLFVADKTGRSPYDMLKSSGSDLTIVKYVTLKELAAVAVRKYQLPYRNRLPPHLFELLERL